MINDMINRTLIIGIFPLINIIYNNNYNLKKYYLVFLKHPHFFVQYLNILPKAEKIKSPNLK